MPTAFAAAFDSSENVNKESMRRRTWGFIGGGVLAVGVAALLLAAPSLQGGDTPVDATTNGADAATSAPGDSGGDSADETSGADNPLARRDADDYAAIGDIDAPLVMVEYADYRCPFCGLFSRDTMPIIIEEYVEPGLLRIEWRDAPLFGQDSVDAAVAARAAGEQGRFWQYHDAIYEVAPESGHADMPREKLVDFAEQVGVPDLEAFEATLDSQPPLIQVSADQAEARQIGLTSVPSFVIGQEAFSGAHPIDTFRTVIDEQLSLLD